MIEHALKNIIENTRSKTTSILENKAADKLKNNAKTNTTTFNKTLQSVVTQQNKAKKPVDKRLMKVCIEMESIFVAKMLKEMRKTVHKSELFHGGYAEEIFEDMLYDKYALSLSKNSNLGLAKMLYNQLSTMNQPSSFNVKK